MNKPTYLSLEEQIARKCIHFNGIMSKECKAGVKYADVRVDEPDVPYKFPCLKQAGECPKAQFRTDEEVKQMVADIEGSSLKVLVAIASIKEHVAKTSERGGHIPCQCGGQLHFAVADINGHIRAKCNTCDISFNE